jgi:hypothetical protein
MLLAIAQLCAGGEAIQVREVPVVKGAINGLALSLKKKLPQCRTSGPNKKAPGDARGFNGLASE